MRILLPGKQTSVQSASRAWSACRGTLPRVEPATTPINSCVVVPAVLRVRAPVRGAAPFRRRIVFPVSGSWWRLPNSSPDRFDDAQNNRAQVEIRLRGNRDRIEL